MTIISNWLERRLEENPDWVSSFPEDIFSPHVYESTRHLEIQRKYETERWEKHNLRYRKQFTDLRLSSRLESSIRFPRQRVADAVYDATLLDPWRSDDSYLPDINWD